MKPRLKWYWRVVLTGIAGAVFCTITYFTYGRHLESYIYANRIGMLGDTAINMLGYGVVNFLFVLFIYHHLTKPKWIRGCTLCGKCGYILKGLPEPRCPECGTSV